MQSVQMLLVPVALMGGVTSAAAQSKPDFSGTWVVVSPESAAGQEQIVAQSATAVTTSHDSEGGGHHATYKLDGTESRNVISSHGDDIVSISNCSWDGDRLVILTTTRCPDGRKLESKRVWSLDAQGRLTIDSTETMPGRPPQTTRAVWMKKR